MNKHFLRVRVDLIAGGTAYGYICLNDVTMFREHTSDCGRVIVDSDGRTYSICMKISEFRQHMEKLCSITD